MRVAEVACSKIHAQMEVDAVSGLYLKEAQQYVIAEFSMRSRLQTCRSLCPQLRLSDK